VGSTYNFNCPSCGYHADVSGGLDVGFMAVVQTVTCHQCSEVVDVSVMGVEAREFVNTEEYKSRKISIDRLDVCDECGKKDFAIWTDSKSCPKCDERMVKGECVLNWD
jgi:hypothetical protein